jgi:hypothetical protein
MEPGSNLTTEINVHNVLLVYFRQMDRLRMQGGLNALTEGRMNRRRPAMPVGWPLEVGAIGSMVRAGLVVDETVGVQSRVKREWMVSLLSLFQRGEKSIFFQDFFTFRVRFPEFQK